MAEKISHLERGKDGKVGVEFLAGQKPIGKPIKLSGKKDQQKFGEEGDWEGLKDDVGKEKKNEWERSEEDGRDISTLRENQHVRAYL